MQYSTIVNKKKGADVKPTPLFRTLKQINKDTKLLLVFV